MKKHNLLTTLFSFQGRMRRSHFWAIRLLAPLALAVVLAAVWLVFGLIAFAVTGGRAAVNGPSVLHIASVLIWFVLIGLVVWADLAASVKRCHDRNKPGWFLLISLIPLIGGLWLLVELGFLEGDHGRNQYGPSPKFPERSATVFA